MFRLDEKESLPVLIDRVLQFSRSDYAAVSQEHVAAHLLAIMNPSPTAHSCYLRYVGAPNPFLPNASSRL
ncbi:unnamed protein product [Rhizoctonia solani]|uniref:Uncharacterized protein n=1 Tax=Rhizoctonia solani TaxID=456999 RepID=A0A8H2X518_9AGAM|nr:unnamed protein product [Rhizoctonia solani]